MQFGAVPQLMTKEGIGFFSKRMVAKHKNSPYVTDRETSTWFKILNRAYSQTKQGREELFERERHKEPVLLAS